MFGKLKNWRRIHTRYNRCAHAFMSAVCIAASVIFWLPQGVLCLAVSTKGPLNGGPSSVILLFLRIKHGSGDLSNVERELIGPLLPPEHGRWARPAGDNQR